MKVLLVTSRDPFCGISCHSDMLMEYVRNADPTIEFEVNSAWLDPGTLSKWHKGPEPEILHLNYQAGLHSRWTAAVLAEHRKGSRKVVVTYHDTGVPNSEQCQSVCAATDAFVVHEPYKDLIGNGRYWRMGVPELAGIGQLPSLAMERPFVGTVGHDFPWKCWPELCQTAASVGWGVLICAPAITLERHKELLRINPWLAVREGCTTTQVLQWLRGCDATAFVNVCHNTGQSAAILMGLAARKPVLALSTCRQYRALLGADVYRGITWCETFDHVKNALRKTPIARFDAGIVALAEQDSWINLGARYAELYHSLI